MSREEELCQRGYARISSPDERWHAVLMRPTPGGVMWVNFDFSLAGKFCLADEINQLGYVEVDELHIYDENLSTLRLLCNEKGLECALRLMEDLPDIMMHCKSLEAFTPGHITNK